MFQIVEIFRALSDENRLRMMNLLYGQELCVCDIMATLNISQAKASRHLIYLKNVGLVKSRKHAQWSYYSWSELSKSTFLEILNLERLRKLERCQEDLRILEEHLKYKKVPCSVK